MSESKTADSIAVPDSVLHACAEGRCVLVAGSGLAAQFGFRTRTSLLRELAKKLLHAKERLRNEILDLPAESTDLGYAALIELVGRDAVIAEVRASMRYTEQGEFGEVRNPKLFRMLSEIPFSHCVTVNVDRSLRDVFKHPKNKTASPLLLFSENAESEERVMPEKRFVLAELFGSISVSESDDRVFFTTEEVRRFLLSNRTAVQVLMSALAGQTLLFAGFNQYGIEEFYRTIPEIVPVTNDRDHVALVPEFPDAPEKRKLRDLERELFRAKYGLHILPFGVQRGRFRPFLSFFEDLHSKVQTKQPRSVAPHPARTISRVALQNIGPFAELALDLTEGWNVVVGSNGAGKSVIMRAIAFGLIGENAATADVANGLLRHNAKHGRIEISMNGETYTIALEKGFSGVTVTIPRLPPLLEGRTLAFGFPAARGTPKRTPIGAHGAVGSSLPELEDVLPLIRDAVDKRVDEVKQWLLQVEVQHRIAEARHTEGNLPVSACRSRFFEMFRDLFGGELSIEPDTAEVFIKTPDAVLPLEAVSAGTSSAVGVLGYVLKRMCDVFGEDERPWEHPAILLIDEIEAHLHPEWQRRIVALVRDFFPNLQIVATTHSPLVVTSAESVFVARWEYDGAVVEAAHTNTRGLTAEDLLLARDVFGLESTRPPGLEDDLVAYDHLDHVEDRTPEEQSEMERLRTRIAAVLNTGVRNPLPISMLDDLLAVLRRIPLETAEARVSRFLAMSAMPNAEDLSD